MITDITYDDNTMFALFVVSFAILVIFMVIYIPLMICICKRCQGCCIVHSEETHELLEEVSDAT